MIIVELKDIRMHAYHGIYERESIDGGEFEVQLQATYQENPDADFTDLDRLVDYAVLFEIVRERMLVPTPLIEKVANDIASKIKFRYPVIRSIRISIFKTGPPIPHMSGKAGVTIIANYED